MDRGTLAARYGVVSVRLVVLVDRGRARAAQMSVQRDRAPRLCAKYRGQDAVVAVLRRTTGGAFVVVAGSCEMACHAQPAPKRGRSVVGKVGVEPTRA